MEVLITGGAGYIGSHVANGLLDLNHKVFIIDNLSTGHEILIPKKAKFEKCDISDKKKINSIISKNNFDAIMHFAASIKVEESIKNPEKYYSNNSKNSQKLLEVCIQNNLYNVIFSSTAAIYGNENSSYIHEKSKISPINPYGESKLITENYLMKKKDKFNSIILRYFNVAGADPDLRCGLISKDPSHLIKIASEVAMDKRKYITINGDDYNTKDGTAVRDYIHVSDLADIHIKSLDFLLKKRRSEIFNCGYGNGYSVKEVIETFNKLLSKKINIKYGPRRKGDAEFLVSNIEKLKQTIDWKPKYNKLDYIIKTAINWEDKLKNENSS